MEKDNNLTQLAEGKTFQKEFQTNTINTHLIDFSLSNELIIGANQIGIKKSFMNKYTFDDIRKNKYFLQFDNLNETFDELHEIIKNKNNNISIEENENNLNIKIPLPSHKNKELNLQLNQVNKKVNQKLKELNQIIIKQNKDINDLKNEITQLKQKNSKLELKYENLKKEKNKFKDEEKKINNLDKEIIKENEKYDENLENNQKIKLEDIEETIFAIENDLHWADDIKLTYNLPVNFDLNQEIYKINLDEYKQALDIFKVEDKNIALKLRMIKLSANLKNFYFEKLENLKLKIMILVKKYLFYNLNNKMDKSIYPGEIFINDTIIEKIDSGEQFNKDLLNKLWEQKTIEEKKPYNELYGSLNKIIKNSKNINRITENNILVKELRSKNSEKDKKEQLPDKDKKIFKKKAILNDLKNERIFEIKNLKNFRQENIIIMNLNYFVMTFKNIIM